MITSKEALKSLQQEFYLPQEEMLEVRRKKSSLYIGIPKETAFQEHRVPLTPDAVGLLVGRGHEVVVEADAGLASHFSNKDYSEAGAQIMYSTEDVYKADIILKVAPPGMDEIALMQRKQTLFSALQLTMQPRDFIKSLMDKKVSAVAWDYIRDEEGIFPVVRAMGEIAGNTSILIAAELLSADEGRAVMFGGISGVEPSEVVIIGAGTVAEYAARAAIGLGASVKIFDNSIYKLRRLQNDIGMRLFTSTLQPRLLKKALKTADVAIGAIRADKGRTPCVVSEEMVQKMKPGSVIVDVSIDQGGCFETAKPTTHEHPTYKSNGVIHYCVPNIASRVSRTASQALSNIFLPILLNMAEEGGVENIIRRNKGVRSGVYLYNGTLTNRFLGESFNLPYKEIDLLLASAI